MKANVSSINSESSIGVRCPLPDELETLRAFYDAAAEEAGVTLTVESPSALMLRADRALFQRALGNLLTNALAHTPRGGQIAVRATSHPDRVMIEVTDTGSGIAPEHLPHVFDRLYRADAARTSPHGAGLGLAIVKTILELHSGMASISSIANRGTSVRLEWPRFYRPGVFAVARLETIFTGQPSGRP